MPMSSSVMVNRTELLALLDEPAAVRSASAFAEAQRRRRRPGPGRRRRGPQEAEGLIVRDAQNERDRLVSDTEVLRGSREQQAETDARRGAGPRPRRCARETDEYVDAKLANFEITLERTLDSGAARPRAAGRRDARTGSPPDATPPRTGGRVVERMTDAAFATCRSTGRLASGPRVAGSGRDGDRDLSAD